MVRGALPLLVVAALAGGTVRAEVPLTAALAKAYLENPRLEAARARLRAADEEVPQALSDGRPHLYTQSTLGMERVTQATGEVDVQGQHAGVFLRQRLYDGGALAANVDRAESGVLAERARLDAVEQEVLQAAVEGFMAVLRQQQVFEVTLANERRLQDQLAGTQARFRYGQATRTDVALAEARAAEAVARRFEAEGELRAAGSAYRRVIGDPPGTLIRPGLPPALPASLAEALAEARDHPLIRAARFDLAAVRLQRDVALAALKPRLAVTANAGYGQEPAGGGDWESRYGFGASLTVPLYEGGGSYARIRQARQREGEARQLLLDAERRVEEGVRAAWEARRVAETRLDALARRVRAAALALDGVREEAGAGARNLIEVLEAEQELVEAEVAQALGREAVVVSAYRLLAAVGGLTAEKLALDISLYDPEAYYDEVRDLWLGLGRGDNGGR